MAQLMFNLGRAGYRGFTPHSIDSSLIGLPNVT
jgi:hypothetical protein